MMSRITKPLIASLAALLVLLGTTFAQDGYKVVDEQVANARGGTSQVVITLPPTAEAKVPLVLMAHGHGGEISEAGGFDAVVDGLAAVGIATVRVQFPGSGSSTESFQLNTLENMQDDLDTALEYALESSAVADSLDAERVGMLGYSMGGRLAMVLAAESQVIDAVALWAPAATDGPGSLYSLFGGEDAFRAAWAEAERDGFHTFTTPWGGTQELSRAWFDQNAAATPASDFTTFTGPVLVAYGDEDAIVDPSVSRSAVEAASSSAAVQEHVMQGADHGFGFFAGFTENSEEVVGLTVQWLAQHVK